MEEFKSITGCDDSLAQYYLDEYKGNVELAVNKYFEQCSSKLEFSPKKQKVEDYKLPKIDNKVPIEERYRASMLLSAAGDALGYKEGKWEFNKNGMDIIRQYFELGGCSNITLDRGKGWRVSDDTVMHRATAEALVEADDSTPVETICASIAKKYVICGRDMDGRAPGNQTMSALMLLEGIVPFEGTRITPKRWNEIPFDPKAGGCGGAMRAMCIGLRFPLERQRKQLIAVSIESARITHNHPNAFFGAFVSALFTAYAVEDVPLQEWGRLMLKEYPNAVEYVKSTHRDWDLYQSTEFDYFEKQWRKYLKLRNIHEEGSKGATFPSTWGPKERDNFYKSISFDGWGGSSGHDSVMIAYDALLGAGSDWDEFLLRGALHGGDSDTTAAIGGAWFGALYGFAKVPKNNYSNLEYGESLDLLAKQLLIFSGKAS